MRQTLLSPVDLDIVLQWSEMQKMMDDLSETEEDSSSVAPTATKICLLQISCQWRATLEVAFSAASPVA